MALADAVSVAHERGIVHRDLQPAHVLFAADGRPKSTGFSLSKRLDAAALSAIRAATQADQQGVAVGPAADVYALGAILYELLTGCPPFKGETPLETAQKVI